MFSEYLTCQISGDNFVGENFRVEKAGRLNLAIKTITQAAQSPSPTSLFGPDASACFGAKFKSSKRETQQLENHLHLLVRKASLRIEAAFPVTMRSEYAESVGLEISEDQVEDETYVHYTTDRAHYDARRDGYFTYMEIPNELSWDTEGQTTAAPVTNNALVTAISVADATPGWIYALVEHYDPSG